MTIVLTAAVGPHTDVKMTAGGGSRSGPLLPLRLLFWTGCGEKKQPRLCGRLQGPRARSQDWTPPATTPTGPSLQLTNTQKGTHVTWMFDRLKKIKLWPKINQHLKMNEIKPKRHNRTICMIMCTCIERNVIIDLYGENIVHWIYRMIFVFRVWVTNSVRWLEANHWVCSSKITDSAFSFVL